MSINVLPVKASTNENISMNNSSDISVPIIDNVGWKTVEKYTENLDDDIYAVIEDEIKEPIMGGYLRSSAFHTIERARHYIIKQKSTNKILVQFSLHGKFKYNGRTSSCTFAELKTYNKATNLFSVENRKAQRNGIWATGVCIAHNKKTKKTYNKVLKIGVKADGTVLKS